MITNLNEVVGEIHRHWDLNGYKDEQEKADTGWESHGQVQKKRKKERCWEMRWTMTLRWVGDTCECCLWANKASRWGEGSRSKDKSTAIGWHFSPCTPSRISMDVEINKKNIFCDHNYITNLKAHSLRTTEDWQLPFRVTHVIISHLQSSTSSHINPHITKSSKSSKKLSNKQSKKEGIHTSRFLLLSRFSESSFSSLSPLLSPLTYPSPPSPPSTPLPLLHPHTSPSYL